MESVIWQIPVPANVRFTISTRRQATARSTKSFVQAMTVPTTLVKPRIVPVTITVPIALVDQIDRSNADG